MKHTKSIINGLILAISFVLVITGLVFLGVTVSSADDSSADDSSAELFFPNLPFVDHPYPNGIDIGYDDAELFGKYPASLEYTVEDGVVKIKDIGARKVTYLSNTTPAVKLTLTDGYWTGEVNPGTVEYESMIIEATSPDGRTSLSLHYMNGNSISTVRFSKYFGTNYKVTSYEFKEDSHTIYYERDGVTYHDYYENGVLISHLGVLVGGEITVSVKYSAKRGFIHAELVTDNGFVYYTKQNGWTAQDPNGSPTDAPKGFMGYTASDFEAYIPSAFACVVGCTYGVDDCLVDKVCTRCGAIAEFATDTHNYDGATCSTAVSCTDCNTSETFLNPENHESEMVNGIYACCGAYEEATLTVGKHDINRDGIADDEVYEIANAGQLYWFAARANEGRNENAVLTADIVVNEGDVKGYDGTSEHNFIPWTPIGYGISYGGYFDGQGHTVSGLFCKGGKTSAEYHLGFFGSLSTTHIRNIGIINSYFDGYYAVGALVGNAHNLDIDNCFTDATVIAESYAGGIAGEVYWAAINDCYSVAELRSDYVSGGIAAAISGATLKNCYYAADANADVDIYGINAESSTVQNCYLLGAENISADDISVATADRFASGEIAYLLGEEWGQLIGTDPLPVHNGEQVYRRLHLCTDEEHVFSNTAGSFSHSGTAVDGIYTCCGFIDENSMIDGVYHISTAEQLAALAKLSAEIGGSYNVRLTADIDLTAHGNLMLGTEKNPFEGEFDGNGHTVTVNYSTNEEYTALFRYARSLTVKNLTVAGNIKTYRKFAAGIVGLHSNGGSGIRIDSCVVLVKIVSLVNGDGTHGGLVANNGYTQLNVSNCAFYGEINGPSTDSVGGLVGWTESSVTIDSCVVAFDYTVSPYNSNLVGRGNANKYSISNVYYKVALGTVPLGCTWTNNAELLNGHVSFSLGSAWGQDLSKNSHPLPNGMKVYYGYVCDDDIDDPIYTNNKNASTEGKPEHEMTEVSCTLASFCLGCGKVGEVALGHKMVVLKPKAPTCTEDGLTAGEYCERCDEVTVEQTVIKASGHTWTDATVAAPKTCTVCYATEGDPLPRVEVERGNDGIGTFGIVGITVGAMALLGIGGFALVWFVIKKKSFAELLAVFKK